MKYLLRHLFTAAILLACSVSLGQNPVSTYISKLRISDPSTGAQVAVSNDAAVSSGLRTNAKSENINGYRVCVFFDNSQNARTLASDAHARFTAMFADVPSAVIYQTPTFKVMAGNCLTPAEATILKGRVKDEFPKSIIVRESIPLATIIQDPQQQQVDNGGGDPSAPAQPLDEGEL